MADSLLSGSIFPETAINTKDSKCQRLVIKAEVTLYILTMRGFITEN